MNRHRTVIVLMVLLTGLMGCASQSGWTPTVDLSSPAQNGQYGGTNPAYTPAPPAPPPPPPRTYNSTPPAPPPSNVYSRPAPAPQPRHTYTQDLAECKMLAQQVSGYTPEETIKGGLIGGAIGAAAGAAIGAATGNPGKGAAIGAAAGGIGGGAYKGLSAEEKYKQAYINCMRNRGYNVIN